MKPWLDPLSAAAAIARGRGRGVKIAILDSGIECSHPALGGLELLDDLAVVETARELSVVPGGGRDLFGHGTAVAGIVRAGAPEAQIGSFRVLGTTLRSRTAIILEGARAAMERGYHVINCSLSSGVREHWDKYKAWVDEAYLRGIHVVAACSDRRMSSHEWPADFTSVIAVNMARDAGPQDLRHCPGSLVEFAAHGVDVPVAWAGGGVKTMSGSSFAAPHVTAMMARLLSESPGLAPLQVKSLLQTLASPALAESAAPDRCEAVA
jgi:subtilisin family serine protease